MRLHVTHTSKSVQLAVAVHCTVVRLSFPLPGCGLNRKSLQSCRATSFRPSVVSPCQCPTPLSLTSSFNASNSGCWCVATRTLDDSDGAEAVSEAPSGVDVGEEQEE